MNVRPAAVVLCTVAVVACSTSAFAQEQFQFEQPKVEFNFNLGAGVEHQFETDLDGAGDFSVTRFAFGFGGSTELSADSRLSFSVNYDLDSYDFTSGSVGVMGSEPWDDIHTVSLGAIYSHDVSNTWTLFGGPIVQFSREAGADFGDSVTGGGIIGAKHRVSQTFSLGLGLGVVTQIEDDTKFFPAISLDWEIDDQTRLSSVSGGRAVGRSGVELIRELNDDWTAAVGVAYKFDRFRLDTMDGVGEDTGIPVWLRFSYDASPTVQLTAHVGVTFAGELTLEDDDGNELADSEYDPAPFVGISGSLRF